MRQKLSCYKIPIMSFRYAAAMLAHLPHETGAELFSFDAGKGGKEFGCARACNTKYHNLNHGQIPNDLNFGEVAHFC